MIKLRLLLGDRADEMTFPDAAVIAVGRAPGNALRIPDGRVSSLHGEIVRRGGGYVFRDLRSTNGSLRLRGEERTVVDGLICPEVSLATGDVLWLGDVSDPVKVEVCFADAASRGTQGTENTVIARRGVREDAVVTMLFGAPNAEADRILRLLRDVGAESDVTGVLECVSDYLFETMAHATAVVAAVTDRPDEPTIVVERGGRGAREVGAADAPPYPRRLVELAIAEATAVSADLGAGTEASLVRVKAAAAIASPLTWAGEGLGALVVLLSSTPQQGDLDRVAGLAVQLASAFQMGRVLRRLRAVERRLRDENKALKTDVRPDSTFGEIIGASASMRAVFDSMRLVMDTDATVLITGETGTGKELVARALHDKSRRKAAPFAAVNCAALSENLLESELFGHMKGAFTGAVENKKGLFQVADRGTLFLDELGEMSLTLQAKLLRALQEGEILPVGSTRPIRVDVRVLAATHRDLRAMVKASQFREDLFYRVNVFPISLPPLRERKGDIGPLASFLIGKYEKKFGKRLGGISVGAIARLEAYGFPGNIRELENEMQRAVLLTPPEHAVDASVLSEPIRNAAPRVDVTESLDVPDGSRLKDTMDNLEREVLRRALEERGWNRSQTARDLGISRQALMVKLSKYGLEPE